LHVELAASDVRLQVRRRQFQCRVYGRVRVRLVTVRPGNMRMILPARPMPVEPERLRHEKCHADQTNQCRARNHSRIMTHDPGLFHPDQLARSRKAFATTETDERLIANAAIIGESSRPVQGHSTPAAIGTPRAL